MRRFLRKLRKIGFKVITKPVKRIIDETGREIEKANFDVEITGDTLVRTGGFEIMVLFSGDSDFAYLADLLRGEGRKIVAFSSRRTLSWELRLKADRYFLLERLRGLTKRGEFVKL